MPKNDVMPLGEWYQDYMGNRSGPHKGPMPVVSGMEIYLDVAGGTEKFIATHTSYIIGTRTTETGYKLVYEDEQFDRELNNDLWAWLRGFAKCEDCDGKGFTGEWWPGTEFQPPEPVECSTCNGSGQVQIS